jgi:CubicO group peptidase (beta-lactamase class C family)
MADGDRINRDRIDQDRIDEVVEAAVRQGQAPGVVAAVARGDATHVKAAGVIALGGPPMRRETLFRISSTTKPITAAVVLSLVDDGLLDLNEPVEALLPELADRRVLRRPDSPLADTVPAERPVTVRDLLTFTWGFGMQGAMFMAPGRRRDGDPRGLRRRPGRCS